MSPSRPSPPSPANGKLESPDFELENKKEQTESSEMSTGASSTTNGGEQPELLKDDSAPAEKDSAPAPPPAASYPKPLEAFFILLALLLGISLMSLDQVSSSHIRPLLMICQQSANHLEPDHCCNRDSSHHGPVPQNRRHRVVRLGILPNHRRIPVAVGQNLQILPSQNQFSRGSFHL
jgi:hypothetical protein